MAKAKIGVWVLYCGHKGMFLADIWEFAGVNVVHASRPVTNENLRRQNIDGATHHLIDFPLAGFWKPNLGIFVVPKQQVREIKRSH